MNTDEAREIVRRELQAWGGPDGLRGSMLADDIREAAEEWMAHTLHVLNKKRTFPHNYADLPEPPNWSEIVDRRRGGGRPPMNEKRDAFISHVMETLVFGNPAALLGTPPVMKIRPAARIAAQVLTAAGIEITGRQIEAVYRKGYKTVG